MEKKIVVVWEKNLADEQRKNYKKEHPGYRLSFSMRYPNFPIYVALLLAVAAIAVAGMTELLTLWTG